MILCVGGSGFIGKHVCEQLDAESFDLREGNDAHDLDALTNAMRGCRTVVHLASNADIAASAENPMLDFDEGTAITQNVCEAARIAGVKTILYASGSGVYGKPPENYGAFHEDDPCEPCSPYGASKLAGEGLVSAYCHMYGMRGIAYRFANVIGPGQTHGVGLDFISKLWENPNDLEILGDGKQTKSYISVFDVISAMLAVWDHHLSKPFEAFNIATDDRITVDEIAAMACAAMGATPEYSYAPSWAGDVPDVSLGTSKIRSLGWDPELSSRDAMKWTLRCLAPVPVSYGPGDDLA